MIGDYEKFIDRWMNGIRSELEYWDQYIETRGYGNDEEFREYTAMKRPFILDDDLELPYSKVIDVGSGPFSICGTMSKKGKIDFKAVDIMAPIYERVKERFGLSTEVKPEFAILEELASSLGVEQFDIVHISNALDHTFDPMRGIWQLLAICKVSGKIILQHHQNEAEAAGYNGLHQWNCTLQNGKFEIWNKEKVIDVAAELMDVADITFERHAPMDKVVIRKLKPFYVHQDMNQYLFDKALVQAFEHGVVEEYYQGK